MKKIFLIIILLTMLFALKNVTYAVTNISSIMGTTNISNIRPKIGERKKTPVVNIATKNVSIAYSGCYWMKLNGASWQYYSGATFTEGTYRYHYRFEVDASVASVSNPVSVLLDGVTQSCEVTSSGGKYYISANSREYEAIDNVTFEAKAFVYPSNSASVYFGGRVQEAAPTASFVYSESQYDLGSFGVIPKIGYQFKEWRVGSVNGEIVALTEQMIKEMHITNPTLYVDTSNGVHFLENKDYVFYAIFERSTERIYVLKGDLTLDNFVNSTDAAMALDLYKNNTITSDYFLIGNMNGDSSLNATDASLILDAYKNGTTSYVEI